MAERLYPYTEKQLVDIVANELADYVGNAALFSRLMLARSFGQQTAYQGQRDYYETLGYPPTIVFDDYLQRYERQDLAARVVDLPAVDTWKLPPQVSEEGETETDFVKEWDALVKRLRVWSYLSRADRLSGVGRYGVLLIGVKSEGKLSAPVEAGSLASTKEVLYLRPFSEGQTEIKTWEDQTDNPRYGLPVMYALEMQVPGKDTTTKEDTHWTRIIHLADNRLDSEIYGQPRLQRVYNRLDDLIKIVGGGSEAAWLNMRPPTAFSLKKGFAAPDSDAEKDEVREMVRKIMHDMARVGVIGGYEAEQFGAAEIPDPRALFDITISCISAASGIPQRVLLGSAAGELAAAKEDTRQWAGNVAARQSNYAEPDILRAFIDRLIWYGALPPPEGGYDVGEMDEDGQWRWPSIVSMTELEEAEVISLKAGAVESLSNAVAPAIDADERRALLGYPPEEVGDEEPEAEPTDGEPEGVEMPEKASADGTPAGMVAQVWANLREGSVTPAQAAEYAMGVAQDALNVIEAKQAARIVAEQEWQEWKKAKRESGSD